MGKQTFDRYHCDRCKADLGDELPKRNQGAAIVARFDFRDGPGNHYKWDDLCDACDRAVKAFFLPMGDLRPSGSERREARAMIERLLAAPNEELADYHFVRLARISSLKPKED